MWTFVAMSVCPFLYCNSLKRIISLLQYVHFCTRDIAAMPVVSLLLTHCSYFTRKPASLIRVISLVRYVWQPHLWYVAAMPVTHVSFLLSLYVFYPQKQQKHFTWPSMDSFWDYIKHIRRIIIIRVFYIAKTRAWKLTLGVF